MRRIASANSLFIISLALLALTSPRLTAGRIGLASGWQDTADLPGLAEQPAANLASASDAGEVLAIVQFGGPIQAEWIADCEAQGVSIYHSIPEFAYLVRATQSALSSIQTLECVEWVGFLPANLRQSPAVAQRLTTGGSVPVTILSVTDLPARWLRQRGIAINHSESERLRWHATQASVPQEMIDEVASLWSVFYIEPTSERQLMGERGAQVAAGNYLPGATGPTAPGYVDWLTANGLQGGPGLIVQVADDGIDQGVATGAPGTAHPDILGRIAGIFNAGSDPLGDSADGHGQINAGIIMGNATVGTTGVGGYLLGQGMAPMAQVYGTKIFTNGGAFDIGSNTDQDLAELAQAAGVTFSNNSWGAPVGGAYTTDSAIYDALVRDANPTLAGNQQITYFFSAGNSGPSANTLGAPGTAKNIITVGATENSDADGSDTCGWGPTVADDIQDLAPFSSRGPSDDGRIGVSVVAVGTHVQGPSSSHAAFNGSGVCGTWPAGQTDYVRSTGTSHSTPIACGAGMIIHEFFSTQLSSPEHTSNPSPAMIMAVLANTATDLADNGDGNGGTISPVPDPEQGWGSVNLSNLVDMKDALTSSDQEHLFTGSGQSWEIQLSPVDLNKPIKITLVWTDAPGNPVASPNLVNDLNLVVTSPTDTYLGNVFSGGLSVTGGSADTLNNIEAVYIDNPMGFHTVRVEAFNIAADGVPGNASALDQDFALFVTNGIAQTSTALVDIDRIWVNDGSSFIITVSDADLRGEGTISGLLTSGFGDMDLVTLAEAPAGSGVFEATVNVTNGPVEILSGHSETLHDDTIRFSHFDADDGTGNSRIGSDTVLTDFVAPAITSVAITSPNPTRASVAFDTDEPATTRTSAGLNLGAGTLLASGDLATEHSLTINGLMECTTYVVSIEATDRAGNTAIEMNGGLAHTIQTLSETTILSDDFEGAPQGWTTTGLWHLNDATSSFNEANSPTHSYWFGQEVTGNYNTGARAVGQLRSPAVANPISLTFQSWEETEDFADVDTMKVYVEANGVSTEVHATTIDDGNWDEIGPIDLMAFSDDTVNIIFEFDSDDNLFNDFRGWYIDDVVVMSQAACSSNSNPNAVIDHAVTLTSVPVTIEVLDNDIDTDVGDSMTVASVSNPSFGSVVINSGSSVTYTPNVGFTGLDAFTYLVRDANGGAATARVEVMVGPMPTAPDLIGYLLGVVPGDPNFFNVNGDGVVDAADLIYLMQFTPQMPPPPLN